MELALRGTSLWVDHITVDGALVTEVDYGRYTVVELRSGDGQHVRVTLDKEFGRKLRRALRLLELSDQVEKEESEPGPPVAMGQGLVVLCEYVSALGQRCRMSYGHTGEHSNWTGG